MKIMKVTYFRDPFGGYHGVTDESPKGLSGCVCAGRGPEEQGGIETVKERAYAVKHLQEWERGENVPDEWLDAIGYEVRLEPEFEPEFEPSPKPEKVKLEFAPWQGYDPEEYMKDPVFWILCAVIFPILWFVFRGIFP